MPDPDPPPPRAISLDYAAARAADAFAARGLVYVLAAYAAAELLRLGWSYGDQWLRWTGYGYPLGVSPFFNAMKHTASAAGALAGAFSLVSAGLAASGHLRSRHFPIAAGILFVAAWLLTQALSVAAYFRPPSGISFGEYDPVAFFVSQLAFNGIGLFVPSALLWLFCRRRFAAALAAG